MTKLDSSLEASSEKLRRVGNCSTEITLKFKFRKPDDKGEFDTRSYDLGCAGEFMSTDIRYFVVEGLDAKKKKKVLHDHQRGFFTTQKHEERKSWLGRSVSSAMWPS